MAQIVKLIVNELNKSPFNLNLTAVSFSTLQPPQILQLLSDVICEIESKDKVDISEEATEALTVRLLTSLQILKFKPESENPNNFRENLIAGQAETVHPILYWLLKRKDDLKKRAYLSRFLVKVEITPEMRSDSDVMDLYEQYEQLIEEFKQKHKQFDSSQSINDMVVDLRKDLQSMEDDREILVRRIERTHRKVENVANYNQLLSMAKKIRCEKEKYKELTSQKEEQKNLLNHLESKRQRLSQQLIETRQLNINASGQGLLQRAEDAVRVNQYMIQEKLAKEIQKHTKNIVLMEKIFSAPNPLHSDLQAVSQKNEDLRLQIAQLTEKRALEKDSNEDGMVLYRQQAMIASRKKEANAERLNQLRLEVNTLETQLQVKRQQLGSDTILSAEQFKVYVSDLRVKSNVYKQKRAELNDLKAEFGILSRTLDVLKGQEAAMSEHLDRIESMQGVKGFRETREVLEKISDEKAHTDEEKARTLEEMSNLVHKMNAKIAEKKVFLAPLLKELRPLRQKYQESLPEYEAKKREYDAQVEKMERSLRSVEEAKNNMDIEIKQLEEKKRQLESDIERNKNYVQRAVEEMRLYINSGAQHTEKGKSMRDQLQTKIVEKEKLNAQLRQEQRQLSENLPRLEKQMQYWEKLDRIFKVKTLCQERDKLQEGTIRKERGRETLVLQ